MRLFSNNCCFLMFFVVCCSATRVFLVYFRFIAMHAASFSLFGLLFFLVLWTVFECFAAILSVFLMYCFVFEYFTLFLARYACVLKGCALRALLLLSVFFLTLSVLDCF